jgi:hypothetical protein
MATVTPPSTWSRDDTQRRVVHPLQRLRGYIRTYVTVEGLALALLYMAWWFWITLALDYGFFKIFGIDFVQTFPMEFRVVVLIVLSGGLLVLVAGKVVFRLFREFRDGALAMVLERRFPAELGDRLITAVELADPRLSDRYGYSQPMVDETVREAADRVNRLPVADVFNWKLLRRHAIRVIFLTLGLYLLIGLGYCVFRRASVEGFVVRFNTVAGIWFERNVLLHNTLWPRRAYLELINFPISGDLRVGRDAPPPALRVRALKWVVADRGTAEGWRAMKWSDITTSLYGKELPSTSLLPDGWRDWTLDQIELQLDKPETKAGMAANTSIALIEVFSQLEARAQDPHMARKFRQLVIPKDVTVYYKGETVRSEQTLKKQAENEYAGVLSDLKESVRFTVNGEDYYTPYQQITIVPPPSLVVLAFDTEEPAYLHHRPPAGEELKYLKGKKHVFQDRAVSLSGAVSRVPVPAGTNVVLKGKTDKPLRAEGGVRLLPREASASVNVPVQMTDTQSLEVRFNNVTALLDFIFEMTDTDNVVGLRHVTITPEEDMPPEIDMAVEVIRKVGQAYMVTPVAHIPFSGRVRDDHGIHTLDFNYQLTALDSQAAIQAGQVASLFQLSPPMSGSTVLAPGYLGWLGRVIRASAEDSRQPPRTMPVGAFAKKQRDLASEDLTAEDLEKHLRDQQSQLPALKEHVLDPQDDKEGAFDVGKLGLKVTEDRQYQPRYRMRLWMVATDNNIETGPAVGQAKEKFVFLIVSENELILEIAKEEETLHLKLEDTVNKLKDARNKLDQVMTELPELKPNEFSPMARRAEEIIDALGRGLDVTREVYLDYSRILRETQVNQINPKYIERIERGICQPLNDAINQEFDRSDRAMRAFHQTLEEKKKDPPKADEAKKELTQLIDRLTLVLDAMGEIITINKLIQQLESIKKAELTANAEFKRLYEELQKKILDEAFGKDQDTKEEVRKNEKKEDKKTEPKKP